MKYVWDNANIVESYPGICSPLTFSFARYVYREVYLQTAPLFGVERKTVARIAATQKSGYRRTSQTAKKMTIHQLIY